MRLYSTALLLLTSLAAIPLSADLTFYVSPDGRDTWSGTLPEPNAARTDGPFATLPTARDALRALRAGEELTEPVRILLRSGVYRLAEPLVFGPQDSGTASLPVTYAAYQGEAPVISGGVAVESWTKQADGVWTASLPGAERGQWPLRSLFVNGERRVLARSPNEGFFRLAGQGRIAQDPRTGKAFDPAKQALSYDPADLAALTDLEGADVVAFYHWETAMLPVAARDEATDTLVLTGEMKWPFWAGQRYYVENARQALDAPGEWWLDRAAGALYYRPMEGEDPSRCTIVAPRLTQLISLQGDTQIGQWVDNLRFEGLTFSDTDYLLEPEGHGDWQAAVAVPAVFQATGARSCAVDRCRFLRLGQYAVWLRWGCQGNKVTQCEITDVGAGGVRIGEGGIAGTPETDIHHNEVSNCFIHDIGIVYHGAIGVWIGQSSDNLISHNEICDTNYSAISCGWTWGYGPTNAHRNTIEYNHLHHLARGLLSDMGAIYTLGASPGTTLRYNLIHDVWCFPEGYGAGGIYPDEGSSELLIENNVVYHTISGGLTLHYGKGNTVRNNIFAFARDQQVVRHRDEEHLALTFERNIVYHDAGRAWVAGGNNRNYTADYNCYWNASGEPLVFLDDLTLEDWQKEGLDLHSIVADPKFRDPKNADFRLPPDSPAVKLGFEPIDISTAGLTGPPEWVELPRKIKRAPVDFGAPPVPKPRLVNEDFEKLAVTARAADAITWGETPTATIRVTDQQASSGKHSLQFTDAPGLDFPYNPHIWYTPNLTGGVLRFQYDLRIEPGAEVGMEWRDAVNPYRVGPSMGIDETGQLTATGQQVLVMPPNEWVHFDIACGLGKQTTGTYDLTVTAPGQPPVTLTDLPCDPKWKRLEWLGFVSNATDRRVFYLDNLVMELTE